MMAKIKFDANKAAQDFKRKVDKVIQQKEVEQSIGDFLVERVRLEARRGSPLNSSRSFPPLADSSKAIRRAKSRRNTTHPGFDADRSNLTFSGQLIDAITFKRSTKSEFTLFVDDNRRRPLTGDTESLSNDEVDKRLRRGVTSRQYGRREFILFDLKGIRSDPNISSRIKEILLRYLRRQLRRS
jgi:hypothetical protein